MDRVFRGRWLLAGALLWGQLCWQGALALPLDEFPRHSQVMAALVQDGNDPRELRKLLADAVFRQEIIDIIQRPAEAKPWYQYRAIFLTRQRIAGGVTFWRENQAALRRMADRYGVPPEVVVAIIGVETRYGAHKGRYRVLDALTTLALSDYKRNDFFARELGQFLRVSRAEKRDPRSFMGSYAGAMGIPQFMPSSFLAYAVDFDGDGRRDLWDSAVDAIGSVGNYLAEHGWQRGQAILDYINLRHGDAGPLLEKGLKPSLTRRQLSDAGFTWPAGVPDRGTPVALLEFDQPVGVFHVAAYNNFYAITRYNHSALYALAVYQLAEAIRQGYRATAGSPLAGDVR